MIFVRKTRSVRSGSFFCLRLARSAIFCSAPDEFASSGYLSCAPGSQGYSLRSEYVLAISWLGP